jgi:hypothetical protein
MILLLVGPSKISVISSNGTTYKYFIKRKFFN